MESQYRVLLDKSHSNAVLSDISMHRLTFPKKGASLNKGFIFHPFKSIFATANPHSKLHLPHDQLHDEKKT